MWRQCVWAFGTILQDSLHEAALRLQEEARGTKKAGRSTLGAALLEHYREQLQSGRQRRLVQYFFASRRALRGAQTLSIALDFSRVSHRHVGLGAVCTPGNTCIWAPPQAPYLTLL